MQDNDYDFGDVIVVVGQIIFAIAICTIFFYLAGGVQNG